MNALTQKIAAVFLAPNLDDRVPRAKKAKRSNPVSLRGQNSILLTSTLMVAFFFCRFCEHSIDFTPLNTVNDHIESKKHSSRKSEWKKELHLVSNKHRRCIKPKDLREEGFVSDVHCG